MDTLLDQFSARFGARLQVILDNTGTNNRIAGTPARPSMTRPGRGGRDSATDPEDDADSESDVNAARTKRRQRKTPAENRLNVSTLIS